jgi:tetratricopeptide (TPR) repeat protein
LVVENWIEKYGIPSLRRVLDDLGVGMNINESLARYAGGIAALDQEFAQFARKKASDWGALADWEKTEFPKADPRRWEELQQSWSEWLGEHPNNYWGRRRAAEEFMQAKKWDAALEHLKLLTTWTPEDGDESGPYGMVAACHRSLEQTDLEYAALQQIAERSSDCRGTLKRLAEIDGEQQRWDRVAQWTKRLLEIQPMLLETQEKSAWAAERADDPATAARALEATLSLDPIDPAATHLRLAKALRQLGSMAQAKRHVLMALEESPRYREARELLRELTRAMPEDGAR